MKRSHPRPKTNKRNTTNKQPEWWDEVCTKAKYDKYHNLRRYRRTNSKHDLDIYLTSKNVFKNLCRAKCLSLKRQRRNLLIENNKNPRCFGKSIKHASDRENCNTNVIDADIWREYFEKLFSDTYYNHVYENMFVSVRDTRDNDILDCEITDNEIVTSLNS